MISGISVIGMPLKRSTTSAVLLMIIAVTGGCKFGSDVSCTYPCHCSGGAACDEDTGDCPNGCDYSFAGYAHRWSGPGCQDGNVAYGMNATNYPESAVYEGVTLSGGLAVDGSVDTNRPERCSRAVGHSPSWEVVFNRNMVIDYISLSLTNQDDSNVQNIIAEVGNQAGDYVVLFQYAFTVSTSYSGYPAQIGDRLRLRKLASSWNPTKLELCEVFVGGYIYEECEKLSFGAGCLNSCECQFDCDDITGGCIVDTGCQRGQWGSDCEFECYCRDTAEICDRDNGHCLSGCDDQHFGGNCSQGRPSVNNTIPIILEITLTSVTITFDVEMQDNDATGYLVQYQSEISNMWQNGSRLDAEDRPSYYSVIGNLQPNTSYQIQIVAFIEQDAVTYFGDPSPSAYFRTPIGQIPVEDSEDDGMDIIAVVIGATIGIIGILIIIIVVVIFIRYCRRADNNETTSEPHLLGLASKMPIVSEDGKNRVEARRNSYDHNRPEMNDGYENPYWEIAEAKNGNSNQVSKIVQSTKGHDVNPQSDLTDSPEHAYVNQVTGSASYANIHPYR